MAINLAYESPNRLYSCLIKDIHQRTLWSSRQ